jgi:membrane-bound lytic murein transglycosylase D
LLPALVLCLVRASGAHAATDTLPRPPELREAVQFWIKIYSEVDTSGGLLHDRDNLAVVYERLSFRSDWSPSERQRHVRQRKAHYREQLRAIAAGDRRELTAEQREILAAWPGDVSDARLRQAARGIRFQLGQSDRFRAGLVRSGAWEPHIRRTLLEMGLPQELAALPHVESSFNPAARSVDGAAGIWQFTRATGQRYMRIDRIIDERMDPFASSVAAARLLKHNHSLTNSWPLALTAYNHGLAGVRRAAREVGTQDFGEIVTRYEGPNWGFASRNFYAAFLAAVSVDFDANKYFGDLERDDPIVSETVEVPFFADARAIARGFDVDRATLKRLNKALRGPLWRGGKRVPRGYALRVPAGPDRPSAKKLLGRIERDERYYAQVPDRYHEVRPGEAVSTIARRYGVSLQRLVSINDLPSADHVRAGQTLRLPLSSEIDGYDPSKPVYTVRPGDTLSDIAARAGMSSAALAARNGIDNPRSIQPGQQLRVDSMAPKPATTASAASGEAESNNTVEDEGAQGFATSPLSSRVADGDDETIQPTAAMVNPHAGPQASQASEKKGAGSPPAQQLALTGGTRIADSDSQPTASDNASDAGETQGAGAGEHEPDLAADPADYSVAADATIEVQAAETLGHYAQWLDLRASELRRINDMRYGEPVIVGTRLRLDFTRVPAERFEKRRTAYHERLQGRFFERFRIAGSKRELAQTGDSLWSLAQRADNVPVWLLRQYNPDLDFSELKPGMTVTLPRVERQQQPDSGPAETQAESDDAEAGHSGA